MGTAEMQLIPPAFRITTRLATFTSLLLQTNLRMFPLPFHRPCGPTGGQAFGHVPTPGVHPGCQQYACLAISASSLKPPSTASSTS